MPRTPAESSRRRRSGFSLPELAVVVAVSSILLALAGPAYQDWIAAQQLLNHAQLLADTLTLARTEAVRHGHRINVCKSPDGSRCTDGGGWDIGFLMHADRDADGNIDVGDVPVRAEPRAPRDITISANFPLEDYVSFTSLGHARRLSGALQMGTFTVCKPGRNAVLVVLANSGRIRVDRRGQPCG